MWKCIECGFEENEASTDSCVKCQAARDPSTFVGEQIGQWRLEKPLGEGGMAVVYLARHVMLGSKVAIKLLRSDLNNKREVIERFRTEALAASHLRHDNVIQVMDFGFQKGLGFYMVLEFLEGQDLEQFLDERQEQPVPVSFVVGIARQMAAGLQVAHEAGIIHRDLKPSNIFLVPREGEELPLVKILDFGIAKIQESELLDEESQNLTRTGTILGTPFYLSPEQLRRRQGTELGPSVDIYAFGVILYQMLTGKLPIEEPTIAEQMVGILTKTPPRAGEILPEFADSALELFLLRALAKSPNSRPATVHELWEDFAQSVGVLEDEGQNEALRQAWEKTYKAVLEEVEPPTFLQRYRWVFAGLLLTLVGGGGWLAASLMQQPPPPPPKKTLLAKVKELGIKDFNGGKYLSALKQLEKVVKSKKWNRGSKAYDPKVYDLMARALYRVQKDEARKLSFAALQFFKLYLKESKGLSNEERNKVASNIKALKKRVDQVSSITKKLLNGVAKALKEGRDADAFKILQRVFKLNKGSAGYLTFQPDPSFSEAYTKAASLLQRRFPTLAVGMLKRATQSRLPPTQLAALKQTLRSTAARLKQRRAPQWKALGEALSQSRKSSRKIRAVRRSLSTLVNQNVDAAPVHRRIWKSLEAEALPSPRHTRKLINTYIKVIRTLRKDPRNNQWYKKLAPSLHTVSTLRASNKALRLGQRGLATFKRGQDALQNNRLRRAKSQFAVVPERLQRAVEVPKSLLTPLFSRLIAESKEIIAKAEKAESMWQKVRKLTEDGKLGEAQKLSQELMKIVKGTSAEKVYRKQLEDQKKSFERRCEALERRAKRLLAKARLRQAQKLYKQHASCFQQMMLVRPQQKAAYKKKVERAQDWREKLSRAVPLLDTLQKERKKARRLAANKIYRKLTALLKESPARRKLKKEHLLWERKLMRFKRFRRKGDKLFQSERWELAVYEYKQAQKLFPAYFGYRKLKRRILECECNSGVTWEICKQFRRLRKP